MYQSPAWVSRTPSLVPPHTGVDGQSTNSAGSAPDRQQDSHQGCRDRSGGRSLWLLAGRLPSSAPAILATLPEGESFLARSNTKQSTKPVVVGW